MNRYARVWWQLAKQNLQVVLSSRFSSIFFFLGKFIRFGMYLLILFAIGSQVEQLAGYSLNQLYIFFLSYNLVDLIAQILYRSTYNIRSYVANGELDLILSKPINPLWRVLFGDPDINDVFFLIPVLAFTGWVLWGMELTLPMILLGTGMLINGLLIATAFHVLICSAGIVISDATNLVWLYREVSGIGRFPLEIFRAPIRFFFEFVIPVGIMMNVPAKALLGLLSPASIGVATLIGIVSIPLSIMVWNHAIKQYSSASS